MADSKHHFETRAVHTGVYQDKQFRSVTTPIYTSSTFAFDGLKGVPPFDYTRSGNPTRQALQDNLAALEGGHAAFATSSGMSAILAAIMILQAGDHVVVGDEIYGGTHRLVSQVMPRFGLRFSHVPMNRVEAIEAAIEDGTKMIWIETPTNPLLNLVDIQAVTAIARERGILTVVDNTFLTPVLQRPFDLGADIVVHSTTKAINGHSDVVGGAVVTATKELSERVYFHINALGLGEAPFDAWLVLRGLKTLVPRVAAQERNAHAMATMLDAHPLVKQVFYPGLPTHPQHDLAKRQQKGFGGMLSFELDAEKADIEVFLRSLQLFSTCVSLGGVESLIEQPYSMSHLVIPHDEKIAAGITEGIIRVSAGIEHPDDLVADMEQAIVQASAS